jgi:hypothetical protein
MQLGIQKNFLPLEHLSLEPLVFPLLWFFFGALPSSLT